MIDLDALIRAAVDLEPLPATVTRLASVIAREDSDLEDVAEIVSYDQALTARLLRYSNSAMTGGSVSISTAKAAVMRLGSGVVLSLATASGIRNRIAGAVPEYGLAEGELWRHSVASALAAERAASFCRVTIPPESFTAALLHDVGKLVLCQFLQPEVLEVLRRASAESGLPTLVAEGEVLGVHHAELGGLIVQHWKLPESIVRAISFHHTPGDFAKTFGAEQPEVQKVCDVVHLADGVAKAIGTGISGWGIPSSLDDDVLERLGLKPDAYEKLCASTAERLEEVLSRYDSHDSQSRRAVA